MKRVFTALSLLCSTVAVHAETMVTSCYDQRSGIAAHKDLPFGTILRLTYPLTGETLTVVVHDRGPFVDGRDLDIACKDAKQLGFYELGHVPLEVEVIEK